MCFYLRVIVDEESQIDRYLAQRDRAVDVDSASDEDAGTKSEYNDSDMEGTVDTSTTSGFSLSTQRVNADAMFCYCSDSLIENNQAS